MQEFQFDHWCEQALRLRARVEWDSYASLSLSSWLLKKSEPQKGSLNNTIKTFYPTRNRRA